MSDLDKWEKPWVRDFRGTNRSRPSASDRGVGFVPSQRVSEGQPWSQQLTRRIEQELGAPRKLAIQNLNNSPPPKDPPMAGSWPPKNKADGLLIIKNKGEILSEMQKHPRPIPYVTAKEDVALAIGMQENERLSSNYPLGDVYPVPRLPKLNAPTLDARGISSVSPIGLAGYRWTLPPSWSDQTDAMKSLVTYGDLNKRGDAANYGLFKMNWYMIKNTDTGRKLIDEAVLTSGYRGKVQASEDVGIQQMVGARINRETSTATAILEEAMAKWSMKPPNPYLREKGNFWAGHRWGQPGLEAVPEKDWQDIRNYYDAIREDLSMMKKDGRIWHNNMRIGAPVPNV